MKLLPTGPGSINTTLIPNGSTSYAMVLYYSTRMEVAMSLVNLVQTYSLNGYFLLIWGGTILLLRHHIQRVGKVKFWVLVCFPVVFFLSYEISYYQAIYPSSPVTTAISSNLMVPIWLDTYALSIAGVLFGIGFRSISRSVSHHVHVRDYMVITAYGFIL